MAQILVPGVAQARVTGTVSGHPWNAVWHYKIVSGGSWTTGQLGTLTQQIMLSWASRLAVVFPASAIIDSVEAVDLGVTQPAAGASSHAPVSGTAGGPEPAPQLTTNVKFLISSRYRGGHPRTALPAMAQSFQNPTGDSYTPTGIGDMSQGFSNLQDDVFAAIPGIFQAVPRYTYSYTPSLNGKKIIVERTGLKEVVQVLNWICQAEIGTQRRRNQVSG